MCIEVMLLVVLYIVIPLFIIYFIHRTLLFFVVRPSLVWTP